MPHDELDNKEQVMTLPRKNWCLALSILCAAALSVSAAEITKDSLATVKKYVAEKKALLVDVREKSEWDKGHLEGSIFLPLSALKKGVSAEQLAKKLPKDKILYTFCVVGKRAVTAGNILEEIGYEVRPLKPGYKELVRAGFKKAEKQ
jgi:rhodanese-related sulfurtransferase